MNPIPAEQLPGTIETISTPPHIFAYNVYSKELLNLDHFVVESVNRQQRARP